MRLNDSYFLQQNDSSKTLILPPTWNHQTTYSQNQQRRKPNLPSIVLLPKNILSSVNQETVRWLSTTRPRYQKDTLSSNLKCIDSQEINEQLPIISARQFNSVKRSRMKFDDQSFANTTRSSNIFSQRLNRLQLKQIQYLKQKQEVDTKISLAKQFLASYPHHQSKKLQFQQLKLTSIQNLLKYLSNKEWSITYNNAVLKIQRFRRRKRASRRNKTLVLNTSQYLLKIIKIQQWQRSQLDKKQKAKQNESLKQEAEDISSKSQLLHKIKECHDWFGSLKLKLQTEAQIKIAYHWRKYHSIKQQTVCQLNTSLTKSCSKQVQKSVVNNVEPGLQQGTSQHQKLPTRKKIQNQLQLINQKIAKAILDKNPQKEEYSTDDQVDRDEINYQMKVNIKRSNKKSK